MSANNNCRGDLKSGSACGECPSCCNSLISLVELLTDPGICKYDHNGRCQSHGMASRPCPHEVGQSVVERFCLPREMENLGD